jgi:hypothetical protein
MDNGIQILAIIEVLHFDLYHCFNQAAPPKEEYSLLWLFFTVFFLSFFPSGEMD